MSRDDWDSLRTLFEGALERPPHERAAFIEARSQGDAVLRREVESLLAAHGLTEGILDEPPRLTSRNGSGDGAQAAGTSPDPPRLETGSRLGVFEILSTLGVGGMGEVYSARDTRLHRSVAIKILSTRLEIDDRSRRRFEREARAIAGLSHPHICTVHDVGSAEIDGVNVPFLVMEWLDGETLAARVARGPIALDVALRHAVDIADALTAAHGQGIVHRDIKPANVMLTTAAGVKLLDFGLAQLRGPDGDGRRTEGDVGVSTVGLVFGTLPYMSPEQVRGEPADARSDIFAFGALLHEMVTGARPFQGDSQAALVGAILEREPPSVRGSQPLTPSRVDRAIRRCLAKHPDDRWQTARDLRSELECLLDEGLAPDATAPARPALQPTRARWRRLLSGAAVIAGVAAAGLLGWRLATAPPSRVVTHLALNFPPGVALDIPINGISFAVSPDGGRVAYVGVRGGKKSLFVHTLAAGTSVEVADSTEPSNPTFSPDSEWLAFVQSAVVKKVPAAGGPVQTVCACGGPLLKWISDGRLVRSRVNEPLQEVGLPPRAMTALAPGDEAHHTAVPLGNGSLLITVLRGGWQSAVNSVAIWDRRATVSRELVPNATAPEVVAGDTLVFARGRMLFAAPFDVGGARLTGEPRALNLRVQTNAYAVAPMYAVAGNGTMVYAEPAVGRRLVWVDRRGREELVDMDERLVAHVRLSPDGTRVAAYEPDGDRDLWVLGLTRPTVVRLTSGAARDVMPVWSADGSRIFFTTEENKVRSISADGSSAIVPIFDGPVGERIHPLALTPDGTRLLVQWDQLPARIDQRLLLLQPTVRLTPLIGTSGSERDGRLSPNGRWVAYQSDESAAGREGHIAVRPFPDVQTGRWIISSGMGRQPIWSRDGRELFYRTEEGTVMSVPVEIARSFTHGTPVPVVTPRQTLRDWRNGPSYDVSPDGQRFLFIRAAELNIHSLHIVLNWDVEVKAKLGGR